MPNEGTMRCKRGQRFECLCVFFVKLKGRGGHSRVGMILFLCPFIRICAVGSKRPNDVETHKFVQCMTIQ